MLKDPLFVYFAHCTLFGTFLARFFEAALSSTNESPSSPDQAPSSSPLLPSSFTSLYARFFRPLLLPRVCTLLLPSSFASCMHASFTLFFCLVYARACDRSASRTGSPPPTTPAKAPATGRSRHAPPPRSVALLLRRSPPPRSADSETAGEPGVVEDHAPPPRRRHRHAFHDGC